jgi:hypothetical protein
MDRSAFLSALPFLIPQSSHHWPPSLADHLHLSTNTSTDKDPPNPNKKVDSLLLDHRDRYQLSIEIAPQQQQQEEEEDSSPNKQEGNPEKKKKKICRPCFFGKSSSTMTMTITSSRTSWDPAVSDLQIAVVAGSNRVSNNDSTPSCTSTHRMIVEPGSTCLSSSSSAAATTAFNTAVGYSLFIRVDNEHVYGVDWNQIQHIHWFPESYNKEAGDNQNKNDDDEDDDPYEPYQQRRKRTRPASFVLEFAAQQVAFRIYDPDGNNLETLEYVRNTLNQIHQTQATYTAPLRPPSSSTSSPHSMAATAAGAAAATSSSSASTTTTTSLPDQLAKHPNHPPANNAALPKIFQPQQRFEALRDTNATLETIHQILQTPVSAFSGTASSSNNPTMNTNDNDDEAAEESPTITDPTNLSLGPLLTRMGTLQGSVYMTHDERVAMDTQYEQQIQENEQQIEETLNAFFQRQKQQRGPSQNSKMTTTTPENSSTKLIENPQEQYEQLMDQQRQITEERYKHFLLPTRG